MADMTSKSVPLPLLPTHQPMRLTPTDVTSFVRAEQCERFLRFRLAERDGQEFMEAYGVVPQRITPLLSLAGRTFEEDVEESLARRSRSIDYAAQAHDRPENNQEVVAEARALRPGG